MWAGSMVARSAAEWESKWVASSAWQKAAPWAGQWVAMTAAEWVVRRVVGKAAE